MKAILKIDINDWSTKNVPELKKGTIIFVQRLSDTRRKLIDADYMASIVIGKEMYKFLVRKTDFETVN